MDAGLLVLLIQFAAVGADDFLTMAVTGGKLFP